MRLSFKRAFWGTKLFKKTFGKFSDFTVSYAGLDDFRLTTNPVFGKLFIVSKSTQVPASFGIQVMPNATKIDPFS